MTAPSLLPPVAPPRAVRLPAVAERTLSNGLRVLAVRRAGVPLVELRLRIPFAGKGREYSARATLLAETLLAGTPLRDRRQLAVDVQALGGALSTSVDADRLAIAGSALANGLGPLLDIVADIVTSATYPKSEVSGERGRVVQELTMARSQPSVLAREALLARLYPGHPYGSDLPPADAVAELKAGELRKLHAKRVSPAGAILTLVGDLRPAQALDAVEKALGSWRGHGGSVASAPPAHRPGPLLLVDRPGAVQTNIRLGGPALPRTDPRYAALQLANTVYGGYFTSRLVSNIREDKGYTYSPRSGIEHPMAGSRLTIAADVATEVTGPALLEVLYELGRISLLPVDGPELDAARSYASGTLALSTATAAGLASTLSMLAGAGVGPEYLKEHPAALAKVTSEDVLEVASELFAPAHLVAVLLGDAERIRRPLEALGDVSLTAQA